MSELGKKIVNLQDLKRAKDLIIGESKQSKVLKIQTITDSDQVYCKTKTGEDGMKDLASKIETYDYLVGTVYNIIDEVEYGTLRGPSKISDRYPVTIFITPDSNHILPEVINLHVENADLVSYNPANGELKINHPTADVKIMAICPVASYTYTVTKIIRNGVLDGESIIKSRQVVGFRIRPNTDFLLPASMSDIKVTNATLTSYNKNTGYFTIAKPTDNVTIEIVCEYVGLHFISVLAGSSVGYDIWGTVTDYNIQKSYNGGEWEDWDGSTIVLENEGDILNIRNTKDTLSIDEDNFLFFTMDGCIEAKGNTMSLMNFKSLLPYCFNTLFNCCDALITAPELPATELAEGCYANMFIACSSLLEAPALPAMVLTKNCYNSMFDSCSKLVTAPKLPATTLAEKCYEFMFEYCEELANPPAELPATELPYRCYRNMFTGCFKLTVAPIIKATRADKDSCTAMFEYCSIFCNSATGLEPNSVKYITAISAESGVDVGVNMWRYTAGSYKDNLELNHAYYYFGAYKIIADTINGDIAGAAWIGETNPETVYIVPNPGYMIPDREDITVTNADIISYDKSTGALELQNACGEVIISCICQIKICTITKNVTGGTLTGDATTMTVTTTATFVLTPETGFAMPNQSEIEVINATIRSFNPISGALVIERSVDDVIINIICKAQKFIITASLFNGTLYGDVSILYGGTATITLDPYRGYLLPQEASDISIINATISSYDNTTGEVVISNPIGNVIIGVAFEPKLYAINITATNCSVIGSSSIKYTSTATFTIVSDTHFKIPPLSEIKVVNATVAGYDEATGVLIISEPIDTVSITINAHYEGLTLTAVADNSSISLTRKNAEDTYSIEYSTDGGINWQAWGNDYTKILVLAKAGESACFRNTANTLSINYQHYLGFVLAGKVAASGSVMSMINFGDLVSGCFYNLFYAWNSGVASTSLVSAPELPATKLANFCYCGMFEYCTGLTEAPILPAEVMAPYCYSNMLRGTGITAPPILKSKTLAERCYQFLFYECKSLKTAPELPATTLAPGCYEMMFSQCTSLPAAPKLPATTLAECCYDSMFANCQAFVSTPELPATKLVSCCYRNMFCGCDNLRFPAKMLHVTEFAYQSCSQMYQYCKVLKVCVTAKPGGTAFLHTPAVIPMNCFFWFAIGTAGGWEYSFDMEDPNRDIYYYY